MEFNKVNFEKKWKKIEVAAQRTRNADPIANITNGGVLSFNVAASAIISDMGVTGYVDLFQAGGEFAFKRGASFRLTSGDKFNKTNGTNTPYSRVSTQAVVDKIYAATKCRTFRVQRQGEYLVIIPAYDLDER